MTRLYLQYPFEPCFHNLSATSSLMNGSSAYNAAWTLVRCWVVSDCHILSRVFIYICSLSLECAKGLHLYDGRCYQRCPEGTYAGEIIMQANSRRRNLTYSEPGDSSVAKRQGDVTKPTAIEAFDMEPSNYSKTPLVCLPCHYTCATCAGPSGSQCSSCLDDAQLFNQSDVEPKFYCYPKTVLPQINNANWHYKMNMVLVIALVIVIIISLYIIVCVLKRKGIYCCGNNYDSNIKIAYNKLAVDDKYQSAVEIEEEIHKALHKYSSESESEDDLKL